MRPRRSTSFSRFPYLDHQSSRARLILCAAIGLLALPAVATAQVTTVSDVVVRPTELTGLDARTLDELEARFATGQIDKARETAIAIVTKAHGLTKQEAFDSAKHYLVMAWVGTDAAGKLVARRLLLRPPVGRPFSLDLPGIRAREEDPMLFELFVAADKRASLVSAYASTREDNPLIAQVPEFVKAIITPMFGLIAGVAGELPREARALDARKNSTLFVTASRVYLPFSRATIKVKSLSAVPKTADALRKDLDRFVIGLRLDGDLDNPFAHAYAPLAAGALVETVAKDVCTAEAKSSVPCLEELEKALTATLETCKKTCSKPAPGADDLKALEATRDKFRGFVKAIGPTTVEGEVDLKNRPPVRITFGAVEGVITNASLNKPRAKLEGGKLVADPMNRLLTMAVINWSPWGYDGDSFVPTRREYVRFFGGAALTPNFGIGGGVAVLIVRGVAVNFGGGVLFYKAVNDAAEFGSEPADAKKPFELGRAKYLFVGASFNFGG